ncbi:MAG: hypothetical protein PHI12_07445 [Dehalococcoidales bacterium]|nr:hypothetical protein [Dehalococcoidales bacterium]
MPEDIVGVECGLCHQETFRTLEREITVKAKVCLPCAYKMDAKAVESAAKGGREGLSRYQRIQLSMEESREWARNWHGKRVVITYDASDGRGEWVEEDCHIRGTASLNMKNPDQGWGRLKVVLDNAELGRVEYWDDNIGTFDEGKPSDCKVAVVDKHRWGLGTRMLNRAHYDQIKQNYWYEYLKPLAVNINWGDRNFLVLTEFDEETERLAAIAEQKRIENEERKEAEKHLGEGI